MAIVVSTIELRSILFLQGIKNTELEAVVNVVWAQPEKYGKDFETTMFYHGQMVMKKGCNMLLRVSASDTILLFLFLTKQQ